MNPLLDPKNFDVVVYLVLWASRVRGFQRRWQQPRLRGPEWFFDTPVQPGFYDGPGTTLLRHYAWRMALPCVLDVVGLAVYFITHNGLWLLITTLLLLPAIHLNHMLNVARCQREAQPWAVHEEVEPAAAVAFSLAPRRLRDYTNRTVEVIFVLGSILPFAALWHIYRTVPGRHNAHMVFWLPIVYLYLQLGILLIKHAIVTWRAPVPLAQSSDHIAIRDTMRRYYLLMCDWNRGAATASIVFWPIVLAAPQQIARPLMGVWGAVWLALCIVGAVWIEVRRKQLAELGLKARPVRLPALSRTDAAAGRWPVCWQPGVPVLVLKCERGYSLNLGNTLAYLAAAYLAGMAVLLLVAKR